MASWTTIKCPTLPCGSSTIDQSSLAISAARSPALIDNRMMTRSRAEVRDRRTWASILRNMEGEMILA